MAIDYMRGFTLLNLYPTGLTAWVHLPCLRQATFALYPLPEDSVAAELICPGCGQESFLYPEDYEDELDAAQVRLEG